MSAPFHYRDNPEYRAAVLQRAIDTGRLSPREGELIQQFLAERRAKKGLSQGRLSLYVGHLIRIRDFLSRPYYEMTTPDLMAGVNNISDGVTQEGKPFSQHTKHDYTLSLKIFARWLIGQGIIDIPLSEVKEIAIPRQPKYTKTADDMLSEEEILIVMEVCANSKERAIVSTVYDPALRIEELQDLRWGQVQRLKHGVAITTDKKTGYQRRIPCTVCGVYLNAWRNDYPGDPSGNNHVFLTKDREPYKYSGLQYVLRKIRNRLREGGHPEIADKLGWHVLRHTRLTDYARRGMSETTLGHIGWGHRSSMIECYVHMGRDDIEREVLAIAGIQDDRTEPVKPLFVPGLCPSCAFSDVPPTAAFCPSCGAPLTEEGKVEGERLDEVTSDEEILRVLQDPVQRDAFLAIVDRMRREQEGG